MHDHRMDRHPIAMVVQLSDPAAKSLLPQTHGPSRPF